MENIQDILEQEKQMIENEECAVVAVGESEAQSLVSEGLAKARQEVAKDKGYLSASQEVAARDMRATLNAEALSVLSAEQKNAYQEYVLSQEKKKLDYKIKYEKRLVKEEVKAEVYSRKVAAAIAMYGQYYKTEEYEDYDDDGNKVTKHRYKNFTTSKFVNSIRAFAAWYKSLEQDVRKIIWTTIKVVFFGGLIALIGYGLYAVIRWLANSGVLGQITNGDAIKNVGDAIRYVATSHKIY